MLLHDVPATRLVAKVWSLLRETKSGTIRHGDCDHQSTHRYLVLGSLQPSWGYRRNSTGAAEREQSASEHVGPRPDLRGNLDKSEYHTIDRVFEWHANSLSWSKVIPNISTCILSGATRNPLPWQAA